MNCVNNISIFCTQEFLSLIIMFCCGSINSFDGNTMGRKIGKAAIWLPGFIKVNCHLILISFTIIAVCRLLVRLPHSSTGFLYCSTRSILLSRGKHHKQFTWDSFFNLYYVYFTKIKYSVN